ncbi:MAG: hypothetical protein IJ447_06665 [Clostridia bacterium]|nr:hypothetical protein [Clostridia bacterium]
MKKSKLGLNVCLLGAIAYWVTLFGGYIAALILTGYILLFEDNRWLKKIVLNSLVLSLFISIILSLISVLPSFVNLINSFFGIFEGHFYANGFTSFTNLLTCIVNIAETLAFIILGFTSLKEKDITVPFVSKFVDKYFAKEDTAFEATENEVNAE